MKNKQLIYPIDFLLLYIEYQMNQNQKGKQIN